MEAEVPISRKQTQRPTWSLSKSTSSVTAAASAQAELLRKRRTKNQLESDRSSDEIGSVHRVSETGEDTEAQSPKLGRLSNNSEVVEASLVREAVDNLRQDFCAHCQLLDTKLDEVISHFDDCFAHHAEDLSQKMLDAWQILCCKSFQQDDRRAPPVLIGKGDHKLLTESGVRCGEAQGASLKGSQGKRNVVFSDTSRGAGVNPAFLRPSTPPSFSPPHTPRSLEEVGKINSGKNEDVPASRFFPFREKVRASLSSQNGVRASLSEKNGIRVSLSSQNAANRLKLASSQSLFRSGTFDLTQYDHVSRPRERGQLAQIIWLYLEDPRLLPGGQSYVRLLILIIIASCCMNIVQTVDSPPIGSLTQTLLAYTVDGILTIEIIVRFLVCPNRFSFWAYPYNVLDIVVGPLTLIARATFPFLFPDDGGTDGVATMLLKSWMPLAQLLRLLRRFEGSYLIWTAVHLASEALPVLLYVLLLILTLFASLLYALEPREVIGSLPEAWWFTVVTLGTVGYGDVTPETPAGKIVTCALVIVSALYMAMPLGIVGQVFSEVWADRKRLLLTQLARQRFKSLGYTPKDIPAMFLNADVNCDGNLDMEEFTDMMKQMQFDTSGERAMELFKIFDVDGGGFIDDREFLSILYPRALLEIYGEENDDANID